MAALAQLLNFIYPPRCAACGRRFALDAGARVCDGCLANIERLPDGLCDICGGPLESVMSGEHQCARCIQMRPAYGKARAVARYRPASEDLPGTLPALIRRHKYGLDQSIGRAIAEYLPAALPFASADYDVIVPVPLHRRRLWWRGFNQAALLADALAARLELPLDASSVMRTRSTAPQTARDHDERRRNVRRAFAVRRPARLAGKRVLLVDDVMTTGATADECARAMLKAGARTVDVFTLARVL